ncbi:GDSL esterase/lipase 6 [Selaginella moellendorffii]|uniref:GDSL esterase/lipase 6 n=1 Tax=Selaginella moellendorffii TaxID=88036 RepID=UPI000D1C905A|nr:GDSL esterase/lipase 6 [Selaginella moellendorffii]|eukprot:XP_024544962.1 GDSL esterase/lipase 6 [Selaginella moellendorffii]
MALESTKFFPAAVLLIAIIASLASAQYNLPSVPALFILGDGTVDAGTNTYVNSTYQASVSPYGETFFGHAAGRFTNGRTLADFLAQSLGLPLVPPFVQPLGDHRHGANFASAGSGLLDSTGTSRGVVSFKKQLQQLSSVMEVFKWRGKSNAETMLSESVFVISTGADDIANYISQPSMKIPEQQFVQSLIATYKSGIEVSVKFLEFSFLKPFGALQTLYNHGARKIVVVELGPVGCFPQSKLAASRSSQGFRRFDCLEAANTLAKDVNAGLDDLAKTLSSQLTGIQLIVLKPYDLLMSTIRVPRASGFVNSVDACCGAGPFNAAESCADSYTQRTSEYQPFLCPNPATYMFFDAAHFSEAAYLMMFKNFWHGDQSVATPFNLKDLFAGNAVPFPPLPPRFT